MQLPGVFALQHQQLPAEFRLLHRIGLFHVLLLQRLQLLRAGDLVAGEQALQAVVVGLSTQQRLLVARLHLRCQQGRQVVALRDGHPVLSFGLRLVRAICCVLEIRQRAGGGGHVGCTAGSHSIPQPGRKGVSDARMPDSLTSLGRAGMRRMGSLVISSCVHYVNFRKCRIRGCRDSSHPSRAIQARRAHPVRHPAF